MLQHSHEHRALRAAVESPSRRRSFGLLAGGAVTVAGVLLTGKAGPTAATAQAGPTIVGSWTVLDTGNRSRNLATFVADGGLITTRAPLSPPPPIPGFRGAYLAYSAGQGVWAQSADRAFAYTFVDFSYDDSGVTIASLALSGVLALDEGLQTGSGPYNYNITALDGTVASTGSGAFQFTRIVLPAMPS